MSRSSRAIVLALAATVGIAACGGATPSGAATSDPAAPSSAAPDASPSAAVSSPSTDAGDPSTTTDLCAAITTEEVSTATGAEVAEAQAGDALEGLFACNYVDGAGTPIAGTTLTTSDYQMSPTEFFEANRKAEGAQEISGVGDAAVLQGDETFPILFVLVGDDLLAVSVLAGDLDADGKRQASIDLARIAVDRLP